MHVVLSAISNGGERCGLCGGSSVCVQHCTYQNEISKVCQKKSKIADGHIYFLSLLSKLIF